MARTREPEQVALRAAPVGAVAALLIALTNLVGWSTGLEALVRGVPAWPAATPWTAVWIAGLAVAVLAQVGRGRGARGRPAARPALVRTGRLLAGAVGALSAMVLLEHVLDTTWIDRALFPDAVGRVQALHPGRPALLTAVTVLALAVLVALVRVEARWSHPLWLACQVLALPLPVLALSGYSFSALDVFATSLSNGMALSTAVALLLLVPSTVLLRPDRPLTSWFLQRPDRVTLARLAIVVGGIPVGTWLVRAAATTYLSGERDPWVVAVVLVTLAVGTGVYAVSTRQQRDLLAQGRLREEVLRAHEQLSESEARYRRLTEYATDTVATLSPSGTIEWVSASVLRLLGLDPSALQGRTLSSLVHPEDRPVLDEGLARASKSGEARFDIRLRRSGGNHLWVNVLVRFLANGGGHRGWVTGWRDIADERAAREALAAREATARRLAHEAEVERTLLRVSADALLDPQILLDPLRDASGGVVDFTYADANRAACAAAQRRREELIGSSLRAVSPGVMQADLFNRYVHVVESGEALVLEDYRYRADPAGPEQLLAIHAVRVPDGRLSVTWRDVTVERRNAASLAESEERYRLLATNMADIVALSKDRVFQFVSPSVTPALGWQPQDLVGRQLDRFIHPDDRDRVLGVRGRVAAGVPSRLRYRFRGRDGTFHWIEVVATPFIGPSGTPEGVMANIRVVDDAVRAEEELHQAKAAAEVAATTKAAFLANMSHEIRTPLTAVLGLLHLLRDSPQSNLQRDYTERAERSAQSLLGLLDDILDFSKIEAGALTLHLEPFSLDRLLRQLGTVLAASLGDRPVELLFDLDPATPDQVIGDEMRLRQVLLNLCGNAVKFTSAGHVRVGTLVRHRDPTTVELEVRVEDTGIGMTPQALARVKDSFVQGDPGIARRYGGTGLGLAISSRLLALMGTDLVMSSEAGVGSVFSFTVTLGIGSGPPLPALATPPLDVRLLVGREALRDLLTRTCHSLGWHVEDSADLASRAVGSAPPNVVVFDLSLLADDPEALTRLRQQHPRRDGAVAGATEGPGGPATVLIALCTQQGIAALRTEDRDRLDGYVVKPFTASSLHDAIVTARQPTPEHPRSQRRTPRLSGIRLLVVDDNETTRDVVAEMLRREQADVATAADGAEAVERVLGSDALSYDVVLMDQQMPGMDGLAATRAIRVRVPAERLPILAVTANASDADRRACAEAGMNDHVGKPFELDDLVSRILEWTTTRREGRASPRVDPRPAPQAATPVLDVAAALRRVGGDAEFYGRMLARFTEGLEGRVAEIAEALEHAEDEQAARRAHALAGAASTVGALALAEAARAVEACAKAPGPGRPAEPARPETPATEAGHPAGQMDAPSALAAIATVAAETVAAAARWQRDARPG